MTSRIQFRSPDSIGSQDENSVSPQQRALSSPVGARTLQRSWRAGRSAWAVSGYRMIMAIHVRWQSIQRASGRGEAAADTRGSRQHPTADQEPSIRRLLFVGIAAT